MQGEHSRDKLPTGELNQATQDPPHAGRKTKPSCAFVYLSSRVGLTLHQPDGSDDDKLDAHRKTKAQHFATWHSLGFAGVVFVAVQ
jgi:hypothetical protein